jgi:hypothetical protein
MLVAISLVYMIMVILPTVTIWCDSKYTVQCGNGAW